MKKHNWKWGDILIAAATVVVALSLWGVSLIGRGTSDGDSAYAVIRFADETEQVYKLEDADRLGDISLVSGAYSYILRFENGRVRVLESDCPDQVCVLTGWLSRPGQIAACVPGRLLVRIVSDGAVEPGQEVDVVTR